MNQTYWEELVVLVVSRQFRPRLPRSAGQIHSQSGGPNGQRASHSNENRKNLRAACRMVGTIQASRELSVLEEGELRTLMDQVVQLQHDRAGDSDGDG